MTLRGVVLLPNAMLPLRIFEDRYREMLEDVLASHRTFAVVFEREVVTEAEIPLELPHEVATVDGRISKTRRWYFCFASGSSSHSHQINRPG